jgi:LysR family glycine cleavage system transcriptional activator
MTLRKLPSLGCLEAFVAVAQRQSLTAAAPELNISVSALSRRIQTLESRLGLVLFERGVREFRLTPDGTALMESVCPAIDMLWESIARITPSQRLTPLRLGAPAGFASYWLAPRIADFKAAEPLVEVSIDTDNQMVSRLGAGLHAMVVVGDEGAVPKSDRHRVQCLAPLRVRAVCSPSLLKAAGGAMEVIDLDSQTLLLARSHTDWFGCWLRGVQGRVEPRRTEHYDSVPVLLEAAASGLGVAILPELLANPHILSGRLVDPFQARAETRSSYYFVTRETDAGAGPVERLCQWIDAEMAHDLAEVEIDSLMQTGVFERVARPAVSELRPDAADQQPVW